MKFIFVFIAAVIPWLLITVAPSFRFYKEICEEGHKTAYDNCTGYNVMLFFFSKIGEFANSYSPAITTIATVILAFFTWRLWWSTHRLWRTTKGTLKLARDEFISLHKPKIIVRRFQYRARTDDRDAGVEFVITNTGESKAQIILDNITIKILNVSDMHFLKQNSFPLYQGLVNILEKRTYAPTDRQAQFFPFHGLEDPESALRLIDEGLAGLACFGFIRYKDALCNIQETRFFRTYQKGEKFMKKSEDKDYDDSEDENPPS